MGNNLLVYKLVFWSCMTVGCPSCSVSGLIGVFALPMTCTSVVVSHIVMVQMSYTPVK